MNGSVPVQFVDCTIPTEVEGSSYEMDGVCGTCTKCGRSASAPANGAGGPKTRRANAVLKVLRQLTEGCEHLLPWGVPPAHHDRRIPAGVALAVEDRGRLWPLYVDAKNKLVSIAGGCALDADVLVIPASLDHAEAASEFQIDLVRRGHTRAVTKPAGYAPKPLATVPA